MFPRLLCLTAAAALLATSGLACGHGDAPGGSAGSATTSTSAASAPPTERWTEVASEAAPLLVSMIEQFPPPTIVRRGELLRVGGSRQVSSWKGLVDDVEVTRDGMVFGVQQAKDGSLSYAFQTDLGGEVTITSTTWLCDQLAQKPALTLTSCTANMHRARAADGAIVSYLPCGSGVCPVTLERDGKLGVVGIDGLTNAHFFTGKKRSVLVAETRFVKEEGKVTGGAVEIVTLDGPEPKRSEKFDADEVDARDADHLMTKVIKIGVSRTELRLTGKIEAHGKGGKVESTKPVDEKHALPPLDG